MTGAVEATVAGEKHPLRIGMEQRDTAAVMATLSDDVVFYSPVADKPFVGIDEVSEVIEAIIDGFEELEYPEEWVSGDTQIVRFRGRMGGRNIQGVEFLRHNAEGKVREIFIQARPMASVAAVAKSVGPPLARRRGRANAIAVFVIARLGALFMEVGEVIVDRLYRRPR